MAASAREYPSDRIRNVVVLGHGQAGKTTLIDAMCFAAGSTPRRGDASAGTALTMTTPEEQAHQISIQLTPAFADVEGTKINLLDTPGYLDFTAEALAATRVADGALIVLSSTGGVEVGTEAVWRYCEDRKLPRMLFVTGMDRDNANFQAVFREAKERLSNKVIPVEIPIGSGADFRGLINLFTERAHVFKPGGRKGEYEEQDVPEEFQSQFEEWETELQETLATTNEALLDKYLAEGRISHQEAVDAMAIGMARGEIIPLFCGSGETGGGVRALLKELVELFPSPSETIGELASVEGSDPVRLEPSDSGPFAALVFKTATEPHVGELSFFRVYSGVARNGMEVVNAGSGTTEKLNHLSIASGKERPEVAVLHAGDIGVVAKLKGTHTNDTLCAPGSSFILDRIEFPRPDIAVAIHGTTRADDDKLGEVLPRLHEEDPSFVAEFNAELHQTIARGLGELHLEVQLERMKRKFGVSVETEQPKIAYRETITAEANGQGRFKKQSGGRGQFGDCWIRLRPLPRGEGYSFVNSIKGGVIPTKYVPSVDRGIQEAAQKGIVAGFPLEDFEAECYDGSYHAVDSSDIAFKLAGSMAFQKVAGQARPVLLEPIIEVEVTTPDEYVGDLMGDITQRRGKVLGMLPEAGRTKIRARVPEAELYKYAAALRSMTQGRAHHLRTVAGYEPAPDHIAKRVLEERTAGKEG